LACNTQQFRCLSRIQLCNYQVTGSYLEYLLKRSRCILFSICVFYECLESKFKFKLVPLIYTKKWEGPSELVSEQTLFNYCAMFLLYLDKCIQDFFPFFSICPSCHCLIIMDQRGIANIRCYRIPLLNLYCK
jgi:hypothetical protein